MNDDKVYELLLYCLRMETDDAMKAMLEQLSPSEWDAVVQQSLIQGLAPLLYHRLKTLNKVKRIPAEVERGLRKIYLDGSYRNTCLYHELAGLLGVLQGDDIPIIVLKGAHMAEAVYGNAALRQMCDVDILVRKTDLSRVEERLHELGYVPNMGKAWFAERHFHFGYRQSNGGMYLEVHWHIVNPNSPFRFDVDYLFERARPVRVAGTEALSLSPEDLLLYLCVHVAQGDHLNAWPRACCDIAETIRHYQEEIDWEQVQIRARQWGARRPVYLIFYLAREFLGAGIPDDVLKELKPDGFDPQIETWAREQILDRPEATPIPLNIVKLWRFDRIRDKVGHFLTSVFPPRKAMTMLYPVPANSRRIYLYYPVRLKDLLVRYSRPTWLLLRRDKGLTPRARRVSNLVGWMETENDWKTSINT